MANFTQLVCIIAYIVAEHGIAGKFRCGKLPSGERIVGGYKPTRRSWPWIVSISYGSPLTTPNGKQGGHICGGTLIGLQWVLTAAHCLDVPGKPNVFPKIVPKQWQVTGGMFNRTKEEQLEGNWQVSGVKRFIYHPSFKDYDLYSVNDVAVLQLSNPFIVNDYVRPICLPRRRPSVLPGAKSTCYVAGWGTTSDNSTVYSLTLQEVPMHITSHSYCQQAYTTPATYRIRQHICGGDKTSRDACKGDSGGPLACRGKNGIWFVAGIVSYGRGCGSPNYPGVYTKVRSYQDWIMRLVAVYSVKLPINASKKSGRRRRSISQTRNAQSKTTAS